MSQPVYPRNLHLHEDPNRFQPFITGNPAYTMKRNPREIEQTEPLDYRLHKIAEYDSNEYPDFAYTSHMSYESLV